VFLATISGLQFRFLTFVYCFISVFHFISLTASLHRFVPHSIFRLVDSFIPLTFTTREKLWAPANKPKTGKCVHCAKDVRNLTWKVEIVDGGASELSKSSRSS